QFFLTKRDENSLRKLLPFQQNVHIGVMHPARAKRDAARDVFRQTNYPMLIKIVPSILIWYKIKKIPWGKYKNQEIKQSRNKIIKEIKQSRKLNKQGNIKQKI
ncbi:MAG: hypothetical protein IIY19_06095, partial [Lachnospiraceae bacterium]|nr:hypothetical protein [Lachnospiraceae bacterium]